MEINQERGIIDMFVKRFKRKCSVRGCKNTTNVYLVSKRREMGNTIGICTDCLKEAAASIENYTEPPKVKKEVKSLFPHPELKVTLSSVADNKEPELKEVIENVTEETLISVTEDTVTPQKEEETIIETDRPDVILPKKATTSNNAKKKTNKR